MSRSPVASDWMKNLPMVLLGIRSSTRDDTAVSPAHLVLGSPLRLPGEFFPHGSGVPVNTSEFVTQLQHTIRGLLPFPADFHVGGKCAAPVPPSLSSCPSVFVRVDAVKRPLTPPYVGPFEVLERKEKTFILLKSGKPWTVSIDRLKPCFPPVLSAPLQTPPSAPVPPAATTPQPPPPPAAPTTPQLSSSPSMSTPSSFSSSPASSSPEASASRHRSSSESTLPPQRVTTRFGRSVRPPDRYSP